ncbi:MAG: hypothetical protein WDW36_004112 [Sanguina aurantia]
MIGRAITPSKKLGGAAYATEQQANGVRHSSVPVGRGGRRDADALTGALPCPAGVPLTGPPPRIPAANCASVGCPFPAAAHSHTHSMFTNLISSPSHRDRAAGVMVEALVRYPTAGLDDSSPIPPKLPGTMDGIGHPILSGSAPSHSCNISSLNAEPTSPLNQLKYLESLRGHSLPPPGGRRRPPPADPSLCGRHSNPSAGSSERPGDPLSGGSSRVQLHGGCGNQRRLPPVSGSGEGMGAPGQQAGGVNGGKRRQHGDAGSGQGGGTGGKGPGSGHGQRASPSSSKPVLGSASYEPLSEDPLQLWRGHRLNKVEAKIEQRLHALRVNPVARSVLEGKVREHHTDRAEAEAIAAVKAAEDEARKAAMIQEFQVARSTGRPSMSPKARRVRSSSRSPSRSRAPDMPKAFNSSVGEGSSGEGTQNQVTCKPFSLYCDPASKASLADQAATAIQKNWKAHTARKRYLVARELLCVVQRTARARCGGAALEARRCKAATLILQFLAMCARAGVARSTFKAASKYPTANAVQRMGDQSMSMTLWAHFRWFPFRVQGDGPLQACPGPARSRADKGLFNLAHPSRLTCQRAGITPQQAACPTAPTTRLAKARVEKGLNLMRPLRIAALVRQWAAVEGALRDATKQRTGSIDSGRTKAPAAAAAAAAAMAAKTGTQLLKQSLAARRRGILVLSTDSSKGVDPTLTPEYAAGRCFSTDRVISEQQEVVHPSVKVAIINCYLSQKKMAYVALLGLHWKEAARWKKDRRELGTLAAAHAIIDGDSTTSEAALRAAALAAAAPVVPTFRVLATVLELRALMQQGVHESGLYHAYILKWKLAGLEQQDKTARASPLSSDAPPKHAQSPKHAQLTPRGQPGEAGSESEAEAKAAALVQHRRRWWQEAAARTHHCLKRRFQLLDVDLVGCLLDSSDASVAALAALVVPY